NGGFTPYDGGGLEVSTDGLTWTDAVALNLITSGGYNGRLVAGCSSQNPLAGRLAWVNSSGGWRQVTVTLSPYRGQGVLFRFRLGTDQTAGAAGWWIDD